MQRWLYLLQANEFFRVGLREEGNRGKEEFMVSVAAELGTSTKTAALTLV